MSHFCETLKWLREKHGLGITGVLHIGANDGQEAAEYEAEGCRVIWIEGDPDVYERLCLAIASYPRQSAYCCLCSDVAGELVTFHVASNDGGSSSVLPPISDVFAAFEGLEIVATRELMTNRLDVCFLENGVSLEDCDLINVDVQGFELAALRGLGDNVQRFSAVIAELNWVAAYQGATRPHELESYLASHGFCRAWLSVGYPQGEGIWVKRKSRFFTMTYMSVSMRILELLSALGLFRLLQGTKVRSLLRAVYYRCHRR